MYGWFGLNFPTIFGCSPPYLEGILEWPWRFRVTKRRFGRKKKSFAQIGGLRLSRSGWEDFPVERSYKTGEILSEGMDPFYRKRSFKKSETSCWMYFQKKQLVDQSTRKFSKPLCTNLVSTKIIVVKPSGENRTFWLLSSQKKDKSCLIRYIDMVLHHWGHLQMYILISALNDHPLVYPNMAGEFFPEKFLQHRKRCPSGKRGSSLTGKKESLCFCYGSKLQKKKRGGAARVGLYLVLRTELLPTNLGVDAFGVPSNRHIPPYKKEIHRLKSAFPKRICDHSLEGSPTSSHQFWCTHLKIPKKNTGESHQLKLVSILSILGCPNVVCHLCHLCRACQLHLDHLDDSCETAVLWVSKQATVKHGVCVCVCKHQKASPYYMYIIYKIGYEKQ